MSTRNAAALAIVLLTPLLLAASDPKGDPSPCTGSGPVHGSAPDLVSAYGWRGEKGTTAEWLLTFAEPLQVPDPLQPAFRVDVLVHDPTVPAVSFAYYHDLNRIVRFDARGLHHPLSVMLVPEGGVAPFNPPLIQGNQMTIQVPGRLLLGEIGDDLAEVDLTRVRWTVIVRDVRSCDMLGDGLPTHLLAAEPPPGAPAIPVPRTAEVRPSDRLTTSIVVVAAAAIGVIVVAALGTRRRATPRP